MTSVEVELPHLRDLSERVARACRAVRHDARVIGAWARTGHDDMPRWVLAPERPRSQNAVVITSVAFDRVQHLIRVPVSVAGQDTHRFLVDTGIGITVVSSSFAGR